MGGGFASLQYHISLPAEEVDDLDELLGGGLGPAGDDGGTRAQPAWDLGNMHVRLLDWGEALREMGSVRDTEETPEPSRAGGAAALVPAISGAGNGQEEAALVPASSGAGKGQEEAALSDDGALPPREPAGTTYEVCVVVAIYAILPSAGVCLLCCCEQQPAQRWIEMYLSYSEAAPSGNVDDLRKT